MKLSPYLSRFALFLHHWLHNPKNEVNLKNHDAITSGTLSFTPRFKKRAPAK